MTDELQRFKQLIAIVADGQALDQTQAREAFGLMMSGDATPAQMAGLLMALRVRGETVDEITGGAMVMRERMLAVKAPPGAIDIVGTGGDGSHTFNISTCAAIVTAACGITVAKHGNRGLSSRSGAADVLTALGVDIDAPIPVIEQAIAQAGIGFMMAPRHHGAMRHVAGPRVELGTRTIFNLLGPLSNPASVKRMLVGVFAPRWVAPVAEVLGRLGVERAWVVHGLDGMDELSLAGPTLVAEWDGHAVRSFEINPADADLPNWPSSALKGGDPTENAAALRGVLSGEAGAYRDAVLLTVAAGLLVAGRASTLGEGTTIAAEAIDSGKAAATLERLVAITAGQTA